MGPCRPSPSWASAPTAGPGSPSRARAAVARRRGRARRPAAARPRRRADQGRAAPVAVADAARPARAPRRAGRPAGVRAGQRRPDVPRHRRHPRPRARARTGSHVVPHPSSVSLACARLGWAVDGGRDRQRGRPPARPGPARARARRAAARAQRGRDDARRARRAAGRRRVRRIGADRARPARRAGRAAPCTAPRPAGRTRRATRSTSSPSPASPTPTPRSAPRCRACPTTPTTTTASSPSARSAPSRSPTSRRGPGSCCGTSGRATGRSGSSGCGPTATCRAVAVESDDARAARIAANADALGVPRLRVVRGRAPEALAGLPAPDAVFIGGGITNPRRARRLLGGAAPGRPAGRERRHAGGRGACSSPAAPATAGS